MSVSTQKSKELIIQLNNDTPWGVASLESTACSSEKGKIMPEKLETWQGGSS